MAQQAKVVAIKIMCNGLSWSVPAANVELDEEAGYNDSRAVLKVGCPSCGGLHEFHNSDLQNTDVDLQAEPPYGADDPPVMQPRRKETK